MNQICTFRNENVKTPSPIIPDKDYMYIMTTSNGTITVVMPSSVTSTIATSMSYSYDRKTWTDLLVTTSDLTFSIPITANTPVYFKGIANKWTSLIVSENSTHIYSNVNFTVNGNLMALLYGDDYENHPTYSSNNTYAFCNLFCNGTKDSKITEFNAYTPTNVVSYCMNRMFQNCRSIKKIVMYNTTTFNSTSFDYWMYGASSSGNFYNLGGATYTSSSYTNGGGIKSGWTVHTSLDA